MVKNVLVNASLSVLSVLAKLTPYYAIMIGAIIIALLAFNFKISNDISTNERGKCMPTLYEWINIALFAFTMWWATRPNEGPTALIYIFLLFLTIGMYVMGFVLGKNNDWLKRDLAKKAEREKRGKKKEITLKERN